jgi:DNA modification methylase
MPTGTDQKQESGPMVVSVPINKLKPAAYNPRLMPPEEMAKLRRSIQTYGLVEPLVVRKADDTIIGGHQRWEAARSLGLKQVPVVYLELSEPEAKALNLALNKIQGEWDLPKLGELLAELRELPDLDETLSGFDPPEMDQLLGELERQAWLAADEEAFDAAQAMVEAECQQGPTRVQPGEIWGLRRHRLMCADATNPASWDRLLAGKVAQAIITDPPYGINYVGGRAAQQERIGARRRGAEGHEADAYWDDLTDDQYRHLLTASLSLAHQYSDHRAPLYLWFASSHLRDVLDCLAECGWQERNLLVWVKNNGAGALFAQYKHWYEPCFYAHKQGQAPRWHGPSNERTVWEYDKPLQNDLHPTMKPLPLIERTLLNATRSGQLVLDPFLGSGTAIIAAERTGRVTYGFDWEPRYCEVMLRRWESLTGERAQRLEEGVDG